MYVILLIKNRFERTGLIRYRLRFETDIWRWYYVCIGDTMQRTTVMLPPELKERAISRARERGISLGEFLRESLVIALSSRVAKNRKDDPLFSDRAVFEGAAPSDLAKHHDRYLYDR